MPAGQTSRCRRLAPDIVRQIACMPTPTSARRAAASAPGTSGRNTAGRPRSCRGRARRRSAGTACRAAPLAAATTSRMLLASSNDSRETSSKPPPSPTTSARAARTAAASRRSTIARKARMNMPRAGSVANACTDVSTPERTRNVPSSYSENATIASSTVQLLNSAALLGDGQRMDQRGADEPRHERRVLDRIPEPPAAPAELVVRPPAAERDAAS